MAKRQQRRGKQPADVKVTIIGGGALEWTPTIVTDLAMNENLGGQIVLFDVDPAPLSTMKRYGRAILEHRSAGGRFRLSATQDRRTALRGADFVVLVTEPTPFGLHDLKLAVEMVRVLKLPMGVVINRAGLNGTDVRSYCNAQRVPVLQEIPDDRELAEAYSRGLTASQALLKYEATFAGLLKSVLAAEGGAR